MQHNLMPGNIIHRNKSGFDHPAIILENGYVYENTPYQGEHVSLLSDFIRKAGNSLKVSEYPFWQRRIHLDRVAQQLQSPRQWSALLNNCQDTITRITEGDASSYQRSQIFLAIFLTVLGVYTLQKTA